MLDSHSKDSNLQQADLKANLKASRSLRQPTPVVYRGEHLLLLKDKQVLPPNKAAASLESPSANPDLMHTIHNSHQLLSIKSRIYFTIHRALGHTFVNDSLFQASMLRHHMLRFSNEPRISCEFTHLQRPLLTASH